MHRFVARTLSVLGLLSLILNFPAKGQNNYLRPPTFSPAKLSSDSNQPLPEQTRRFQPIISSQNYIGAEIGPNYSFMQGNRNFYYTFNALTFNYTGKLAFDHLGADVGFLLGGVLDLSLTDFWGLQGTLDFYTNAFGNTEDQKVATPNGMANVENSYSASLDYIGLDILGRMQMVPNSLYALIGFGYSTVLTNTFVGYQKFKNPFDQFFDQRTLQRTGLNRVDIGPNTIANFYNPVRGDIKVGVGTFIPLSASTVVTPELLLSIPITPLFNAATEERYKGEGVTTPNLWYIALSIGIKFPFGETSELPSDQVSNNINPGRSNDSIGTITGLVVDRKTNRGLYADMTVTDLSTNDVVVNGKTDRDGNYSFKVSTPGKFSVTANVKDYLFGSAYYEVSGQDKTPRGPTVIRLDKASGSTRLLVFFDFDKSTLQPSSYPDLNRAVELMKANPDMKVEIAGYTDSVGAPSYNLDLSQRRANVVKDYLLDHGIGKSRVTAKGYGQDSPVESNDTEKGRAENRRVEFVVVNR